MARLGVIKRILSRIIGQERKPLVLARRVGVSEHVHFLGVRDDVPRLLDDAALVTLPSLADPLPLVVVEAMAMGKAVVSTHADGIPEMVVHGETGLLVPPGNSAELARSIASLLGDAQRRNAMGASGRHRVENHFELDRRLLKEIEIYETLLRDNGR